MSDLIEVYNSDGTLSHIEDNRTVDGEIARKSNIVNNHRDTVIDGGLYFMQHFWASDDRARSNVTGVVAGATAGVPLPPDFVWRDNDNINVPFTLMQLVTLGGYMVAWVNLVYNYSWQLKAQLDACTTLDELDNIDPCANWPDGDMDGTMAAYLANGPGAVPTANATANSNTTSSTANATSS